MPKIYHVVACSENRVIGKSNQLPWHFPSDMKFFKDLTSGSTVIMGRKTYDSIPAKFRPLPNRKNFVLTKRDIAGHHPDLFYFPTIDDALASVTDEKAFVIGGASIYAQTLDKVDGIYLTFIHAIYEGDAYYPLVPASFVEKSCQKLQDDPLLEVIYYERMVKNKNLSR